MSACGKKTSGPLGLGVSTCVRASWHDGECRPWLTSDERDEAELATLRADLARVTAELTLTEKRRAEAQRAVHAAMVNLGTLQDQVRELQKVARAAVAWRDQGARSKWATGPSLTLWDVVDALPPSMLEEPSDG